MKKKGIIIFLLCAVIGIVSSFALFNKRKEKCIGQWLTSVPDFIEVSECSDDNIYFSSPVPEIGEFSILRVKVKEPENLNTVWNRIFKQSDLLKDKFVSGSYREFFSEMTWRGFTFKPRDQASQCRENTQLIAQSAASDIYNYYFTIVNLCTDHTRTFQNMDILKSQHIRIKVD